MSDEIQATESPEQLILIHATGIKYNLMAIEYATKRKMASGAKMAGGFDLTIILKAISFLMPLIEAIISALVPKPGPVPPTPAPTPFPPIPGGIPVIGGSET